MNWAALLVGSALSANVAAQVAERPAIKPGDRWRFAVYYAVPTTEPSRDWVVTSVSDAGILGTENGEPLAMNADLNVVESPRNRYSNPHWLQFPLTVGNRWSFDTEWLHKGKGSNGRARVNAEVVAFEKVKVPAGEFEAFKLVARSAMAGTSPIGSTYDGSVDITTYWYAPAARTVVRWEFDQRYLGRSTVELVAGP